MLKFLWLCNRSTIYKYGVAFSVYDRTQAYFLSLSYPNFTIGAGAIAGGVIGGVVLILVLVILVVAMLGFLVLRRKTIPGMCFTRGTYMLT